MCDRARDSVSRLLQVLLAAVLLTSTACRPAPPAPGTLRLVVAQAPEALDTRFTSSAVAQRLGFLVYAPLFIIGEDLAPAPYVATSLTLEDETHAVVQLRDDAVFADGSALTAKDVVFTYKSILDEKVGSLHRARFSWLADVEEIGTHSVRFTLAKPFAAFALELCAIGIVHKASCDGDTAGCRRERMASGPFSVTAFVPEEERLELAANPRFFAHNKAGPQKLTVRVVKDDTTRLLELLDGKADLLLGDVSPTQLDVLQREDVQSRGVRVHRTGGLGYSYLAMNLKGPSADDDDETRRTLTALANPQVRRAIAHALDIDRVLQTKLRKAATRATGMLPPNHWAKNRDLRPLPYDPQKARDLLDAAGFKDRGEGNGRRFHVTLNTTTQRLRRSLALVFAHQLREVGIDVTVRVGEWSTLYADIKRGNFEMFSAKWLPVVEPDLFHWVFHSSSIPGPNAAGGNRGAYKNTRVDALIEAGRQTAQRDVRTTAYVEVEQILLDELPYVPLWFEDQIAVSGGRVQAFTPMKSGAFFTLADVQLRANAKGAR